MDFIVQFVVITIIGQAMATLLGTFAFEYLRSRFQQQEKNSDKQQLLDSGQISNLSASERNRRFVNFVIGFLGVSIGNLMVISILTVLPTVAINGLLFTPTLFFSLPWFWVIAGILSLPLLLFVIINDTFDFLRVDWWNFKRPLSSIGAIAEKMDDKSIRNINNLFYYITEDKSPDEVEPYQMDAVISKALIKFGVKVLDAIFDILGILLAMIRHWGQTLLIIISSRIVAIGLVIMAGMLLLQLFVASGESATISNLPEIPSSINSEVLQIVELLLQESSSLYSSHWFRYTWMPYIVISAGVFFLVDALVLRYIFLVRPIDPFPPQTDRRWLPVIVLIGLLLIYFLCNLLLILSS